jgi:signal peptidase II
MNLGTNSRYYFGAFALVALWILWRLYRLSNEGERARVFALALAWGGAAGNLIDRFRARASVVDFIDIGVGNVRFWTFNVADSAVTVGAILLALVLWREDAAVARSSEPSAPAIPIDGEVV